MNESSRSDAAKHVVCALMAAGLVVLCGWMIGEFVLSPWAQPHLADLVNYPTLPGR